MAEAEVIVASRRAVKGSRAARQLRNSGKIPAVLYGHREDTVSLTIDEIQVETLLRHGGHGLLDLDIEGSRESAVIKELQWDTFGREVLHIDFARVSRDERVKLEVLITLRGIAPGVAEGGVMEHILHEIELECGAANIQESVVVNVNHLHLNQTITVKDLTFLEGVKPLADLEQIVVQVVPPKAEVEEPETGAEGPAEPELIRREEKKDAED